MISVCPPVPLVLEDVVGDLDLVHPGSLIPSRVQRHHCPEKVPCKVPQEEAMPFVVPGRLLQQLLGIAVLAVVKVGEVSWTSLLLHEVGRPQSRCRTRWTCQTTHMLQEKPGRQRHHCLLPAGM